jgi:hypothetical protein
MRLLPLTFLIVFLLLMPIRALSFQPFDHPPPLIRITGTLLSADEEASKRYPTLEVSIAGKQQTLYVREVKSLTSDDRGWPILRNVGAFLILTGPQELVDHLQSEEAKGQPLLIEGRLYIKERVLMLTAVESVASQSK